MMMIYHLHLQQRTQHQPTHTNHNNIHLQSTHRRINTHSNWSLSLTDNEAECRE